MDTAHRPANHPLPAATSFSLQPAASGETSSTSFAFLVHSQDTIPHNLPPSVDNKPLARQRRRRTSPEDQAILEEEFLRDSKPDKAARARIVERVALGEKEVQIWFQNRRQNSRRKSRPLLPHEILSHLQCLHGTHEPSLLSPVLHIASGVAPGHVSYFEVDKTGFRGEASNGGLARGPVRQSPALTLSEGVSGSSMYSDKDILKSEAEEKSTRGSSQESLSDRRSDNGSTSSPDEIPTVDSQTEASTQSTASIMDLSVTVTTNEQRPVQVKEEVVDDFNEQAGQVDNTGALKRVKSKVRLSMTSDGAAKILTAEESSPSPPRLELLSNNSAGSPNSLRRSYSAAGLQDSFASSQSSANGISLRRVPSGRSRDSRAWEFWCDNDVRNELVKKADQEHTGSAADAISLMRSASRGPLTPNPNRGNVNLMRHGSGKRSKTDGFGKTRPLLGRAHSSIGRLYGGGISVASLCGEDANTDRSVRRKKESIEPFHGASGDSDKENNDPHYHGLLTRRAPPSDKLLEGDCGRPILKESRSVPSRSHSLKMILNSSQGESYGRGRKSTDVLEMENVVPEDDEELAKFMRTGRDTPNEDLDCIQGLLSLSQGAWK